MIKKTYIIAEIGNTHEGSLGLAKCFIKAASECGVDAVKKACRTLPILLISKMRLEKSILKEQLLPWSNGKSLKDMQSKI
jgi:sialic acid synthase SpsE